MNKHFRIHDEGVIFSEQKGASAFLLVELLENALAWKEAEGVLVPYAELVKLDEEERDSLQLPDLYPFDILTNAEGTLNQPSFLLKLRYFVYSGGEELFYDRKGCILFLNNEPCYMLSQEQFAFVEAVDEFNALPETGKTFSKNLLNFKDIKNLSHRSGVILDRYLEEEKAESPDKIYLVLERNEDGSVKIAPSLRPENSPDAFTTSFTKFPYTRSVYTLQNKLGDRQRLVFTEEQQKTLKAFKQYQRLSKKEAKDFLENPQEFLDPDVVDLDQFSQRVYDIGLYKPKVYAFISPYKSHWIPSFDVENKPGETIRIEIRTEEELDELKETYIEALKTGKNVVTVKGEELPIATIDEIISKTEKAIQKRQSPPTGKNEKENQNKSVLLIKENIEDLGFAKLHTAADIIDEYYYKPPCLAKNISLLAHQKEGVGWLQGTYKAKFSGVLLADDMGLGKTLQALSFIQWYHGEHFFKNGLYLVVGPVVLLENWKAECNKFFPDSPLSVFDIHGPDTIGAEDTLPSGIYLTTYQTLQKRQKTICAFDWDIVILDEAQMIKTPGNLTTNAAKALKSTFALAMTGTPVENTYMDLWCIMDFCAPGLLGSAKAFAKSYQAPLKKTETDLEELGKNLRETIGTYIKRRTKEEVLKNLPEKTEETVERLMPEAQLNRYKVAVEELNSLPEDRRRNDVLQALTRLREICDHPLLPDQRTDTVDVSTLIRDSAKLKVTVDIIERISQQEEKIILFTASKKTQKLLQRVVNKKFGLNKVSIINGETPAHTKMSSRGKETRQACITEFESKPGFNVIIISPLAAGMGLNITGANHVIHYTRHWNPAKENQSTDRVYRIGQTKPVRVYYPMAVSPEFKSFDVVLDQLLNKKGRLADATLYPADQMEITPESFMEEMSVYGDSEKTAPSYLEYSELTNLNSYLFESACAVLFEKEGYHTIVTPKSKDKGADVICFRDDENLLLQVKQTTQKLGDSVIGEVLKAVGFYEERYNQTFSTAIVTNAQLNENANYMAQLNNVRIYGEQFLKEALKKGVTLLEIHRKEDTRRKSL